MRFRSFWLAGFESASHVNRQGRRLDLLAATQHDAQARDDYMRLAAFDIRTARDGLRWPLIDRGGAWDLSSLLPMVRASREAGVQVIWTLCHYGWPDDLDLMAPSFVSRFARYCRAVAACVAAETDEPPVYTPVNELSFLAWAASSGTIMRPCRGRASDIKRQLVRAALAGADAVRSADPRARIVYVDPVINVVAPAGRSRLARAARAYTEAQYECWDMLLGRRDESLGGHASAIDAMGLNFYHANQWEHPAGRLRWEDEPRDPRWIPLHRLVERVHRRYGLPVFIGETSHFGSGRARWIREIGDEVCEMHRLGIPLDGVCLYPIVDRPDWNNPRHWHNSGLWDVHRRADGVLERVLNEEYATALRETQAKVEVARTQASRNWCTNCTAMEPSPTAAATRLLEPDRTSPAANTPDTLVSSR